MEHSEIDAQPKAGDAAESRAEFWRLMSCCEAYPPHGLLMEATGMTVHFADPHSPWQRGVNEHTNGLVRQYLPKGSDVSGFTQEELDTITWTLNTRPRKSLGFRCPAELFTTDAFDFRQHHAALFALGR